MNHANRSSSLFPKTAPTLSQRNILDIFHSAHSSSVSVSNTFVLSKIYISSDTVYTAWCHSDAKSDMQCLSKVFGMFLVREVGLSTALHNDLPLFSVSHEETVV